MGTFFLSLITARTNDSVSELSSLEFGHSEFEQVRAPLLVFLADNVPAVRARLGPSLQLYSWLADDDDVKQQLQVCVFETNLLYSLFDVFHPSFKRTTQWCWDAARAACSVRPLAEPGTNKKRKTSQRFLFSFVHCSTVSWQSGATAARASSALCSTYWASSPPPALASSSTSETSSSSSRPASAARSRTGPSFDSTLICEQKQMRTKSINKERGTNQTIARDVTAQRCGLSAAGDGGLSHHLGKASRLDFAHATHRGAAISHHRNLCRAFDLFSQSYKTNKNLFCSPPRPRQQTRGTPRRAAWESWKGTPHCTLHTFQRSPNKTKMKKTKSLERL